MIKMERVEGTFQLFLFSLSRVKNYFFDSHSKKKCENKLISITMHDYTTFKWF